MRSHACDAVRDVLPDYVQDRPLASGREAVALHLGACAACAEEARLVAMVARCAEVPDARLAARITRALRPIRRRRGGAPAVLAAAAAVAAALLGASLFLRQTGPPSAPVAAEWLVDEVVGGGGLSWLDNDPLLRNGIGLYDLSLEELEALLLELDS
jgi:anti-sigma factor RsiW